MLDKLTAALGAIAVRFDQWFVPEWRSCLKLFSVQFQLGTGLLLEAVQMTPILPPEVQAMIPQPYGKTIVGLWTFIGFLGRLKAQNAASAPAPAPQPPNA